LIIVRGPGAADACSDPAAQPLQDGCVKFSLAPTGTIGVIQVLATGLERLAGPVLVLPHSDPRNPHA
jgi:hypothetical protein